MPDSPLGQSVASLKRGAMIAYNKWTARVALVVLTPTLLVGIALLPVGERKHGNSVWPLSPDFGHHHLLACVEVGLGLVAVGLVTLGVIGATFYHLLRRARWVK